MKDLKKAFSPKTKLECYEDLDQAFQSAHLPKQGTLLFSPGAPSYGSYQNYEERGQHFNRLCQSLST